MNEWDTYKIKIPKPGVLEDNVSVLEEINHVVHPPAARRILEEGKVRAGIVYDESRMNKTRHQVVWLSANTWSNGSIYGTVQFTFPWASIIKGRRIYWVEAMAYSNPAYRLLVTNKDVSHLSFLAPYDPTKDKGPVRYRDGTWYWNHKYTSEFMIDSDIDLSDCTGFKGINHKRDGCRIYGWACAEREGQSFLTGGRMLAFVLSCGIHCVDQALRTVPSGDLSRQFSYDLDSAIGGIWFSLAQNRHALFGGPIQETNGGKEVVIGSLALLGSGQQDEARKLVTLLRDEATFQATLEEIVNSHFGISGWTLPS